MAYLDRKMEVKFSIEEKVKGTHGVQDLYPYEWSYPVRGMFSEYCSNLSKDKNNAGSSYPDLKEINLRFLD